ncbi:ATP synthase subunit I [Lusitaniella coriacea LEGE 07157]|uniref:ATP synthase subunit I n=1 Tax=Lusitaniella coriacea LEGE 07157 TaxID=945747 RepID=A0A8J7DNM1_9CYAN|nr:ATP synthase subunit I [Lusitaniella coriacea]MBE9114849.1 ATP synthase subunit I [Lusitaniella coriacea LEGE 07157]
MAQVSSRRKPLLSFFQELTGIKLERRFLTSSRWFLAAIGIAIALVWNWKLLLATTVGIGAMWGVYQLQGQNWHAYQVNLQKFFSSTHRQFTLAVSSGGIAALLTYMAASIWANVENRWLAVGAILQGLGTLLTLALLSWRAIDSQTHSNEDKYDRLLADLTQPDPLKRLIAVRQLTRLAAKESFNTPHRAQVVQYFHLLLGQESEAIVRDAVLEGLQAFEPRNPDLRRPTLKMPLNLRHSPTQPEFDEPIVPRNRVTRVQEKEL